MKEGRAQKTVLAIAAGFAAVIGAFVVVAYMSTAVQSFPG